MFHLKDVLYSKVSVRLETPASWIAGPWTRRIGTGCVTRLMTCRHCEASLRMQTSDMWFWYCLMVSDDPKMKCFALILNRKKTSAKWNLTSYGNGSQFQTRMLEMIKVECCLRSPLSEKRRSQTCLYHFDLFRVTVLGIIRRCIIVTWSLIFDMVFRINWNYVIRFFLILES